MHCFESTAFLKALDLIAGIDLIAVVDSLSCRSSNIVYLITRENCYKTFQYIGKTSRSLAQRLTDHRSNIRTQERTPTDFNSENHSVNDLRAVAIEEIHDSHRT